ncbi:MAG TPA: C40 family peptidase [Actinomycetes bacterium]
MSAARARRGWIAASLAAAALLAGLPSGPAAADPTVADARARAAALATQVAALEVQLETATEAYNRVQDHLGAVVTSYLSASQQLQTLTDQQSSQQAETTRRVRALYMSGGTTGLYASVLAGGDISDVLLRIATVDLVLRSEQAAAAGTTTQLTAAAALAGRLDTLAAQRTSLETAARGAATSVETLLATRQAELAAASADVRRLVAADQAAAAAARAAALLPFTTDVPALPADTPAAVVTAITAARSALGLPYQWGATGPDSYDCSGLTQWAFAQAGVRLPRVAADQWTVGTHPSLDQLRPGDLLFWATDVNDPSTIHHVAIYLGGGFMLQAPHTGDVVRIARVYLDGYIGASRPVAG